MNSERHQFINLTKLPGRLNTEETAWCLGFAVHDIPILVSKGFLKPLGNPPQNGTRYFSSSAIEQLRLDTKWLDRASALLIKHWKVKNEKRPQSGPGSVMTRSSATSGVDVQDARSSGSRNASCIPS